MNCYESITEAVADSACETICGKAIRRLQQMTQALLSGDDTPLASCWDEICVQAQSEESFHWDAYEETIRATIGADIEALPGHVLQAIWLQTDRGRDWAFDNPEAERAPYCLEEIGDHMIREYIMRAADTYSNERIRKFLHK
ncbi:hypothetical protein ACFLSJ_00950 [Verrucomicrobiota bacterium]